MSASWVDASGNFWLFGGVLNTFSSGNGYLADLWKFDGTNWTWVSGSKVMNAPGVWGTQGVADPANLPSGRFAGAFASDAAGNFWVWGGQGTDSSGTAKGALNDLWKFDGTNWTWISGANSLNAGGTLGTQGVPAPGNVPGAGTRYNAWVDSSNHFMLFGGGTNLLWRFDGTNWTWMSGSPDPKTPGTFGTRGVTSVSNSPPARNGAAQWIDSSGGVWIFGGSGTDPTGGAVLLADLWKFDGSNWTWMAGSATAGQNPDYGSLGVSAATNLPGARTGPVGWVDFSGNLWMFGGLGIDSQGGGNYLNDLWKFDGSTWTWMAGSNIRKQPGTYGTLGTPGPDNTPGARLDSAVWRDVAGNLWLFGGLSWNGGFINDLWRYSP